MAPLRKAGAVVRNGRVWRCKFRVVRPAVWLVQAWLGRGRGDGARFRSALVGFRVAVWLGGAVVARWARGAYEARRPGLTESELGGLGLGAVVTPRLARFPHRAEQRPDRPWCRWSAMVRRDGRRVGRPGVLGLELSGGSGLTLRSADAAAPRANAGGISA